MEMGVGMGWLLGKGIREEVARRVRAVGDECEDLRDQPLLNACVLCNINISLPVIGSAVIDGNGSQVVCRIL